MSKYSELLRGDVAPKTALNALTRKVAKQGVQVEALTEDKRRARAAAEQRTELDLFVTRAELLEALETGEAPVAWTEVPADPADGSAE